jgi:ABC transporter, phosphonate, periplasmic substrate-binding protein
MGLSLLLKLFEEWEGSGTKVEVHNLNRMVSMLFKITGLGRFVRGAAAQQPRSHSPRPVSTTSSETPAINPAKPFHFHASATGAPREEGAQSSKLNFAASLQTGQQLSGWYLFNTYLQRRMQRAIHFEQSQAGQDITSKPSDLLFAKPFEACSLIQRRSFIPLMRPIGEADEVVILVCEDDDRRLTDLADAKVVTASQGSFVYLLGRLLCDESDLDSSSFDYHFAGNEIKALQLLIRKQADVLFMLKKTYEGISSFSRKNTRLLDQSDTDFAFHLFCIAPYLNDCSESLNEILLGMEADEQGRQILKDIHLQGWCRPEQGELNMLQMVFNRYAATS